MGEPPKYTTETVEFPDPIADPLPPAMTKAPAPQTRSWNNVARRGMLWSAVGLLLAVAVCELLQPDAFAAVTAIPPWCWLLACLGLASLGFSGVSRWERIALGVLLIAFLILCVEQSKSLARSAWHSLGNREVSSPSPLRVVTINCNVGSGKVADEVITSKPDVVLLQESPSEQAVHDLAHELFGSEASVVYSLDCSIVARGRLQSGKTSGRHFAQATVILANDQAIELICVRFAPPVVRYDLWSPTCWRDHVNVRRKHRAEAAAILQSLSSVPDDRPILVGGDCNAPSGDGALRIWGTRLQDAFFTAGEGWGATVLNTVPVLRFDQLWSSSKLRPIAVWSERSRFSDHRLVIGDFELPSGQNMIPGNHSGPHE